MTYWFFHLLGLDDAGGRAYLLWSGVVGDVTLFGVAYGFLRKHQCEVHHCWRLARHSTAAGHHVCRVHHPDDHLTPELVAAAHEAAKAAPYNPFAPAMERLKRKDDQ